MSEDFKIIKQLRELARIRGKHTELISVYVPAGFDLDVIKNQLEQEAHTASNIKDKTTRKNVIDALAKILNELKLIKYTPKNGLVIFCGNVSPRQGESDIRLWSFEPKKSIKIRAYRCDEEFLIEPILSLYEPVEKYGLIVIDTKEASLGILENTRIIPLKNISSLVPGKTRKGGQSAVRFEREREGLILGFIKEVAEAAKNFFYNEKLNGIIVGGPGNIKDKLIEELPTELKNKIIAVRPTQYSDEYGLQELVENSKDVLPPVKKEREFVDRVLKSISENDHLVAIGENNTLKAIEDDNASVVLISDGIEETIQEKVFDTAKAHNVEIQFISVDNPIGEEFLNVAGVASILKKPKEY
ncbi:MAG: peptide chain release factor aRF-1 [Candidatus Parvarchaeota archaeon]|nr:peptide chain release factor aRF-1 [Candidatus Rehaiarchaeum fermentans]